MVRAEACRLLARVVDKLGVSGTLHLPTDARDAVITAATSMVFDNTPTSRLVINLDYNTNQRLITYNYNYYGNISVCS